MEVIIIVVLMAWAVINIILIFKVWKACDMVIEIRQLWKACDMVTEIRQHLTKNTLDPRVLSDSGMLTTVIQEKMLSRLIQQYQTYKSAERQLSVTSQNAPYIEATMNRRQQAIIETLARLQGLYKDFSLGDVPEHLKSVDNFIKHCDFLYNNGLL